MRDYFFTFGVGSPLARYYVKIQATDELAARALMVGMFSRHWSHIYTERPDFGQELDVNRQAGVRLGTNREEMELELFHLAYTSGRVICK